MTYVGATDARGALELGVNHTATAGDILLVIRNIHVHTLPAGHFNLRAVRDRGHAGTHEARLRGDRALAHGGGLIARIDDDANQRLVHTSHHARVNDVKKYHTSIAVARIARSRLARTLRLARVMRIPSHPRIRAQAPYGANPSARSALVCDVSNAPATTRACANTRDRSCRAHLDPALDVHNGRHRRRVVSCSAATHARRARATNDPRDRTSRIGWVEIRRARRH